MLNNIYVCATLLNQPPQLITKSMPPTRDELLCTALNFIAQFAKLDVNEEGTMVEDFFQFADSATRDAWGKKIEAHFSERN